MFFSFAFTIFSNLMIDSSPTVSKTWICLYTIPSELIFFLFFFAAFAETLLCNQINLREGWERREQSHSICVDVKNIPPRISSAVVLFTSRLRPLYCRNVDACKISFGFFFPRRGFGGLVLSSRAILTAQHARLSIGGDMYITYVNIIL